MPGNQTPSAAFSKNMQSLRRSYLSRLALHLKDFAQLQQRLSHLVPPAADLQEIYRLSHNFAGSGSTFGFSAISESARRLYHLLGALLGKTSDPPPAREELLEALTGFIHACAAAVATLAEDSSQPKEAESPTAQAPQDALVIGIWKNTAEGVPDLREKLMHFGYHVVESGPWRHAPAAPSAPVRLWLVSSDLNPQDLEAIDAVVRPQKTANPTAPMIILSPRVDFDTRLAAVRFGAQGYFPQNEDVLKIIDRIERIAGRQAETHSYNVLIVDDDRLLAEHYAQTLRQAGMQTSLAEEPGKALEALGSQIVDLVLLDYTMPGCSGAELASVIRQHAEYVSLPIIFLSAKEDIESQLIDTGLGIDDFLLKPVASDQLVSVVRSRAARSAELRSLMVRDSFTGLLSHAYFLEKLEAELLRVQRSGGETMYAMLDLDHFKNINDTFGHGAGDQVIKSLARMLQQRLRRSDIIGRCGGEEFGILMPGCPRENAVHVLESLREAFGQAPFTFGGQSVRVTLSGGLARLDPHLSVNQLTGLADKALYRAKKEGRNRILAA